jgi:hypothetical protein
MRISRLKLCVLLALGAVTSPAGEPLPPGASRVIVAPMKTSIYVGSVTLTTADFIQEGDEFASTYEAKVRPWFFWGETGKITIKLPAADLTRLALGQTVEFTGTAANQKNKPRTVTGRAQPGEPLSGKIKVRIMADGVELIFNGTYRLAAGPAVEPSSAPVGK